MSLFTRMASVDASALAERLRSRRVLVLDVRQPAEWRHGHIQGARNIPLIHFKSGLAALPRDKTIVTVCASGHRSAVAARLLQRAGYSVENLKGGMRAWTRAGLPVARGAGWR